MPETIIPATVDELKYEFASKLNTGKRKELFEHYEFYCKALKQICGDKPLVQWVDGSYVTPTKNPFDIDIVTFIESDVVKAKEKQLKDLIFPKSMEDFHIDAHIIAVHIENSRSYAITQADRSYWIEQFGKTKPNRNRKRIPKGFLEIII